MLDNIFNGKYKNERWWILQYSDLKSCNKHFLWVLYSPLSHIAYMSDDDISKYLRQSDPRSRSQPLSGGGELWWNVWRGQTTCQTCSTLARNLNLQILLLSCKFHWLAARSGAAKTFRSHRSYKSNHKAVCLCFANWNRKADMKQIRKIIHTNSTVLDKNI